MVDPLLASLARRATPSWRWRRALLWGLLLLLLGVAQTLLVALTLRYEETRAQERVDALAATAAVEVRHSLARSLQSLQSLLWSDPSSSRWRSDAAEMIRARREVLRIERRDLALRIVDEVESPYRANALFTQIAREQLSVEAQAACSAARSAATPMFSRSYFVPQPGGLGLEVIDLCLSLRTGGRDDGYMVASFALAAVLDEALAVDPSRSHELSFVEGEGTRLARAGALRGGGVFRAERVVDLPGAKLQLRADAAEGRPQLIPNLATALVLGLSIALFALVLMLARDVRRRAAVESRLAEALAFRKAMEDSLLTGLRARDLDGRITYVNPAFCRMVGFAAEELSRAATPPYWPPERVAEYAARQVRRLAADDPASAEGDPRAGVETVFMRKSGERFPVMIYEAPLVDGSGQHTGWMSAALDISAQRRIEEVSRQQQERLQATARLATVGEMASLLSHELNQPLAAIASYAAGSINLLDQPPAGDTTSQLRHAAGRIAEQAERAGRVIKSVHDFVRRREQAHEAVPVWQLLDAVLPLVRLQARKSATRIELQLTELVPRVWADRTMVEQVVLNLTRNAIQAMETAVAPDARVLTLLVRTVGSTDKGEWVEFSVADAGPGIAAETVAQLFTPFFTTRREGMGLGLSLCRTVIEQHGGALDFETGPAGTTFRFTLRAVRREERAAGTDGPAAAEAGAAD